MILELNKTGSQNLIMDSVLRLSIICESLLLFVFQLKSTQVNIIFDRIGIIQLLFRYLQELIINTQLQGDLYSIWNIGIHHNIQGGLNDFLSISDFTPHSLINQKTKNIYLSNLTLDFIEKRIDESIKHKVQERNLFEAIRQQEERIVAQEELELLKKEKELRNKITQHVVRSTSPVDLAKIVYDLSRNSSFETALYYPNLLASTWNTLIRDYQCTAYFEENDSDLVNYYNHEFVFEENKIIRIKNLLISVNERRSINAN